MWTAKWAKTRRGFSCSPLGQGAMSTNLFPVIAQVTHFPASTKMIGAYKAE